MVPQLSKWYTNIPTLTYRVSISKSKLSGSSIYHPASQMCMGPLSAAVRKKNASDFKCLDYPDSLSHCPFCDLFSYSNRFHLQVACCGTIKSPLTYLSTSMDFPNSISKLAFINH